MRDYEILHESISKGKGGLSLFENPQKVKITNSEIIPIVPLNKEQEKSVNSFLSDNKLSVVTGPPGTGKSQVVVSALLNAWAQGKTVLFSSSNNTAVDVIKERLDEFDSNTPLYIRAGSKEKNNIQDVLQTVYMMCSEPEDININEIKEEEKKLTRKIKEISKQK
jgi:KaiC/GvpD/RAD55 family RecA-like ATPase